MSMRMRPEIYQVKIVATFPPLARTHLPLISKLISNRKDIPEATCGSQASIVISGRDLADSACLRSSASSCFADTGSFSDTAIALNVEDASRRGRKSSPGSKSGSGSSSGSAVQYQAGLGKKSNSTSQLSATGNTLSHWPFLSSSSLYVFYVVELFRKKSRSLTRARGSSFFIFCFSLFSFCSSSLSMRDVRERLMDVFLVV